MFLNKPVIYLWQTKELKHMARINRSKYNFSKLEMGGTRTVSPLDLYSMKIALRYYNNKHKDNITVKTEELETGDILVTRVEP